MTTAPLAFSLPSPTQDERTNALLVHVLAIFSGFIAPLIFYIVKRESKFVAFHSLQVVIWHAVFAVTFFVGMAIAFTVMILSIATVPHDASHQAPPLAFFAAFGSVWLFGMGGWVLNVVLGIVFAIKANKGEWAKYPVIGNFVLHRILA